jgi:diguanylate cyclase (GGDEF)-like protein
MSATSHKPNRAGFVPSWLAPTALARARMVERASLVDRTMRWIAIPMSAVIVACVVELGPWALAPLVAMLVVPVLAPLAARRSARPESWDLLLGLLALSATAVAAAMTGGPLSPIAYLLLVGPVVTALRGVPRASVIAAAVTAGVFLLACLLGSPSSLREHPLATVALLVALTSVTIASTAMAGGEIAYRAASVLDPLTGLLNRHPLESRFEELRQRAQLIDAPISLVLFDLDHFKAINDGHGHDVGDAVLRDVAYQVRKTLRNFELVYRMGGEEFLVVLPAVTESRATDIAGQLRETIAAVGLAGQTDVTASFGVSSATGDAIDFESLYRQADQALYQAKATGRDRVSVAGPLIASGGDRELVNAG